VVNAGAIALIVLVAEFLAAEMVIRVILTTSWIGQLLGGALKSLGGKGQSPGDGDGPAKPQHLTVIQVLFR
jgi:hypothetical protein